MLPRFRARILAGVSSKEIDNLRVFSEFGAKVLVEG
jgi:hypothetical protein